MTSRGGEDKQYPDNPGIILMVQYQLIPWAHEISTPGRVHFAGVYMVTWG
jgi:hypothetical protein